MSTHEGIEPQFSAHQTPYLVFMLGASVVALVVLAIQSFGAIEPSTRTILEYLDLLLCLLFFGDFLVSFVRAPSKLRYFFTWGWLDLLSSVPVIDGLRWARAGRVFRIIRLLRGARSAKILGEFILQRRTQSAVLVAAMLIVLLLAIGSISILTVERTMGEDANIRTAEDALWWSIVTITTVGYGDKYPVSVEGRMIAAALMFAGVGLFGSLSGVMAAWFITPDEAKVDRQISGLREEIRELRQLILETSSRSAESKPNSDDDRRR